MINANDGIQFGRSIKVQIYGESHAEKIGVRISGIKKGMPVDREFLDAFMARRAPGKNPWSTPRKEPDEPVFISGVKDGSTTGETIEAVIYNKNIRPADYKNIKRVPRPSHADYPAWVKYGEIPSGGGPFSGRMTAALCIAGALCCEWLAAEGISVKAHIERIGDVKDADMEADSPVGIDFATVSEEAAETMKAVIDQFGKDVKTQPVDELSFKAHVSVCPTPTFFQWVFGWHGKITISGPAEVRKEYREMLKNALDDML